MIDISMWIAALLLLGGSVLGLAGGIGILRLPDFYTRTHAAGITDTLCSGLFLAALVVHFGLTLASLKVLLIFMFLLFTCPTASHALARTARSNGLEPWMKKPVKTGDDEAHDDDADNAGGAKA